ncbi:MAG TPA: hypothetical protein VF472_16320 [Burkholderiaceae bacterium]
MEKETSTRKLSRIKNVLRLSISDLAGTFDVTRASIYDWLRGAPPPDEAVARLNDLANAATAIELAGFACDRNLATRRFIGGMTLPQAMRGGQSISAVIPDLIAILQREESERERLSARLEGRAAPEPTADFDFPDAG